ncbi:unnamed protein product [Closterium sp. NIES-54]
MEVARTSMIHAVAPHFLWPFAHQLNLWPCVSLLETTHTLRWMGKVGDASVFRVWGSRAFVRDTSADKFSARTIPCVFLGFPTDAPGWQFYHPTLRRVLPSQDVTGDELVPFSRLFPYRSAPPLPTPLFLAPGPPPVDPLPPQGPAPSVVSQVDLVEPVKVAVNSGTAGGGATRGAAFGGAEPAGAGPGGTEPACTEPGVAESEGAEPGGPPGAFSRRGPLSPPQLREWFARCTRLRSGAAGAGWSAAGGTGAPSHGGSGATGAGGAAAGAAGGIGAAGPRGARTGGSGAAGAGGAPRVGAGGPGAGVAGGTGAAGAGGSACVGAGDPGARDTGAGGAGPGGAGAGAIGAGSGDTRRPRPYFVPLLQQPASPLPAPSPYTEQTGGLTKRREHVSRPASPVRAVRTSHRVPRPRPPSVPSMHYMALRPSSVPQRVPLPSPPASSLADDPDPGSDLVRAASPSVPRLLATVVTDPSFEYAAASALVAELVVLTMPLEDFECFAAAVPHLVSMLLAPEGDPDVPDIPTPCSYTEAITDPYSSQWQTAMNAEMASWKSTGTYVDAVPLSGANIVGHVDFQGEAAAGFSACLQGSSRCTRLQTTLAALGFAPSTADLSLFLCTDASLPPFYVFVYLGLQITRDRARRTISLTQSHMVHQVLQRFGFRYSSLQSTPLPTSHSLSAPPSNESVEPSGPYPELVGCLMYLMTCTGPDLAYPLSILERYVASGRHQPEHREAAKRVLRYLCSTSGMGLVLGGRGPVFLTSHADASWVDDLATQRSSQGYTFSLGSSSVSWQSTPSSSILSSSCEAEIYAGAMAAKELRWLTYLLTDLGERPRSSPVLYVDNKAMIALCQEHKLEHRTKHIALRYFLAQELQQRGQIRLAYVATRANTADIFTKAIQSAALATYDTADQQKAYDPARTVYRRWKARDPAARLAIVDHHPLTKQEQFGQVTMVRELMDVVITHYSNTSTAGGADIGGGAGSGGVTGGGAGSAAAAAAEATIVAAVAAIEFGSWVMLLSVAHPTAAPEAPQPRSALFPASPSHASPPSCLWSPCVKFPASLVCASTHSLHRVPAVHCPSLLISPYHYSSSNLAHGRLWPSLRGVVDDFSYYITVFRLLRKDEVPDAFLPSLAAVRAQYDRRVLCLQSLQ